MDLDNGIMSVTHSGKTNIVCTHKWLLDIKQTKTSLQFTTLENLDNKEDPKRDISLSNLYWKEKMTRSPE